ncbi:hypothetical protein [Burkholderia orbicola]|uniref:hypothetical protein n=1 Tax=Burkholderia orbicola TaxID=2978683 RepID=UPI0026537DE8|nr:hypothetical protein [Burkholderia orbicola]MDN7534052.1 hypothetical protein [Burkholderia orbicola]
MAHKPTGKISTDTYMDVLIALLANGYTDEVRLLTKSIQTNVDEVLDFEEAFDQLNTEGLINWVGTPSQEASMVRVENSLEEMCTFLEGMDVFESYVAVTNHGREVTIEIGWHDMRAGPVVWDRWTVEVDDPVIAFADIGFLFDDKQYRCGPKAAEKPEPPLYRYHPERFKSYREYAESIGKFYRHKVEPVSGMLTLEQLNEIVRFVMLELNVRSMRFPRKQKDSHPSPSLVSESEMTLATAYGRFVQAGRQIMDFPVELTEMLARTDIDDIPLTNIKLPYASQYLHFGPQAELELEPGWLVDGAYVEQRGHSGELRFTVTAVPADRGLSNQWYLFPEAQYTQDFAGNFGSTDLATAIDTVLSDRLAGLQHQQAKAGGDITAAMQIGLASMGTTIPEGLRIVDVGPEMAAVREDINNRRFPIYKAALQLVVNALCYVAAYPNDIDTVWPLGTPESLKQKVLSGKDKEKMRAKSKLASLGYVPVHVCGKRIVEQRNALGIHPSGHGQVATHWRRGHWRNQVHGPGRSLRKLIWLMPVVVGSKPGTAEPEDGHLYLVS